MFTFNKCICSASWCQRYSSLGMGDGPWKQRPSPGLSFTGVKVQMPRQRLTLCGTVRNGGGQLVDSPPQHHFLIHSNMSAELAILYPPPLVTPFKSLFYFCNMIFRNSHSAPPSRSFQALPGWGGGC